MGGGLPCGAIGATEAVMQLVEDGVYEQVGTFNGNPLTMAAARATLTEILTPDAYAHLDHLSARMADGATRILRDRGIEGHVAALGAKGCVVFQAEPLRGLPRLPRLRRPLGPRALAVPAQPRRVPPAVGEVRAVDAVGAAHRRGRGPVPGEPRRVHRPGRNEGGSVSSNGTGIAASLGKVGLPAPVSELAATTWDAVLVGGGHNGLAAAAYLAQAGKSVLVLERREQLGGACTLERPFEDERYTVSPCAYVVGLLDQRVIDELDLVRHGYQVFVADPNLWCPFEDGTHLAQWADPDRTTASMRENGFSDADIKGMFAYEDMFDRLRRALREGARDTWIGDSPDRAEIEELLGHDPELIDVLFDASIADVVGRYMTDERLHTGLYGQGVIGAWAGPKDPGTASIKLMHFAGKLEGEAAVWGYVEGGMGMVSFAIAEAAREAGAVLAAGLPVAEIRPGEGVVLEGGELIRARAVISNADPRRTLGLVAGRRAERVPVPHRRLAHDEPGDEGQLRPEPAAPLRERARRGLAVRLDGLDHDRHRRRAGRVRGVHARACRARGSPSCTSRPRTTRRSRRRASTR